MPLPIGGGTSRDSFYAFWATEDKIYWADGDITPNDGMLCFRTVNFGNPESETVINYSKWTDRQRAEAKAEAQRLYDEQVAEDAKEQAAKDVLKASIKSKLTAEEYELVIDSLEYRDKW